MQGGGELTLCPWAGYGRGPYRTADGRHYCIDSKTGLTYWVSLEPPVHIQAAATQISASRRPWEKPKGQDADAKRPKLDTDGVDDGGGKPHDWITFQMPASSSVRVGESFQAIVPPHVPRDSPEEYEERGDLLQTIE